MNPLDCASGSRWLPGFSRSLPCSAIGSRTHHHWGWADTFDDFPDHYRNADADCEQSEVPASGARTRTGPEQADGSEDDRDSTESKRKHKPDDLDPPKRHREHSAHDA